MGEYLRDFGGGEGKGREGKGRGREREGKGEGKIRSLEQAQSAGEVGKQKKHTNSMSTMLEKG